MRFAKTSPASMSRSQGSVGRPSRGCSLLTAPATSIALPVTVRFTGSGQETRAALAHQHIPLCLLLAQAGAFLLAGLTHPEPGSECGAEAAHHPYTKWGHMSGRHRSGCIACLVPIWHRKKNPDLSAHLNSFNNAVDNLNWKHTWADSTAPDRKAEGEAWEQRQGWLLKAAASAGSPGGWGLPKKFTISAEPCWSTQFPSSGEMMPAGLPFGSPFLWPKPPVRVGRMAQESPHPRRAEVFLVRNARSPLL